MTDLHRVVTELAVQRDLPARPLVRLAGHATGIWRVGEVVIRLAPASDAHAQYTALHLTRWLLSHGVKVTQPLDVDQPVIHSGYAATFWRYYDQGHGRGEPPAHHLGSLLRQLHTVMGSPPVELPTYQPLASLERAIAASRHLSVEDRTWLTHRRAELLHAYHRLEFPLGWGLIHADAYPGNTLWDGDQVRLSDWDEAAYGPRELDLANTVHGQRRFGRTHSEVAAFIGAYGHDPRKWPGLTVLLDMRDLHTLGAYIRRAETGDPTATTQLAHRIQTLRRGSTEPWTVATVHAHAHERLY